MKSAQLTAWNLGNMNATELEMADPNRTFDDDDSDSVSDPGAVSAVYTFTLLFLIVFGTCGNVLCVIVLRHRTFRGTSVGFTLTALAVVDTAVLWVSTLDYWLYYAAGIDAWPMAGIGGCKVIYFLYFTLPHLSTGTLVILTVERTMSICVPFVAKVYCTRERIIVGWCCVAGFTVAINLYHFATTSINYYIDDHNNRVYFCLSDGTFADYISESFGVPIPLAIMLVGNCLVIAFVVRSVRGRHLQRPSCQRPLCQTSLTADPPSTPAASTTTETGSVESIPLTTSPRVLTRQPTSDQSQLKAIKWSTIMLMAPSLFFLVTTLPNFVCFVWYVTAKKQLDALLAATHVLFYTNNACNFLLYCVMGSKFRRAASELFTRWFL